MLILLSPAKTLDFSPTPVSLHSQPQALDQSMLLVEQLQAMEPQELGSLMKISDKLAQLNAERYQDFEAPFALGQHEVKQALLAFKGDVYKDWPLGTYQEEDFQWAQDHLRILSGLYGVLRPMDLMRPYRLEMGTRMANERGKDLYAFWGERISALLADALKAQGDDLVINLASQEYFRAVQASALPGRVVSPVFKDFKNGKYKIIAFYAKKARGLMAHYLIKNRIRDLEGLRGFSLQGYSYDEASSTQEAPVFLRDAQ
jgi:cytoplasmic iron level regulating protein YaaA (DUF328/UPF0246 family)